MAPSTAGIYKQDLSETDPRYVAFVDMGHSSLQVRFVSFRCVLGWARLGSTT
jgi:hypothetical protein